MWDFCTVGHPYVRTATTRRVSSVTRGLMWKPECVIGRSMKRVGVRVDGRVQRGHLRGELLVRSNGGRRRPRLRRRMVSGGIYYGIHRYKDRWYPAEEHLFRSGGRKRRPHRYARERTEVTSKGTGCEVLTPYGREGRPKRQRLAPDVRGRF